MQLHRAGRIGFGMLSHEWLLQALGGAGVNVLPITESIAARAVLLPYHHRDPADRLIIASASSWIASFKTIESLMGCSGRRPTEPGNP